MNQHYSEETERLLSRIRTTHVYPPIPIRSFDWQATLDGYDAGDPIGQGPTEAAAIADLLEQLSERE